jgi:hypothetical protein
LIVVASHAVVFRPPRKQAANTVAGVERFTRTFGCPLTTGSKAIVTKRCHLCGENIPDDDTGVLRSMRTGTITGGGGFYRNVNLCAACADNNTRTARLVVIRYTLMLLAGVTALVGGFAYWWHTR